MSDAGNYQEERFGRIDKLVFLYTGLSLCIYVNVFNWMENKAMILATSSFLITQLSASVFACGLYFEIPSTLHPGVAGSSVLGWPKSPYGFSVKWKTFFFFTNNFIDGDILSMLADSHMVEHWLLLVMSRFDYHQLQLVTRLWNIVHQEISSTKLHKALSTRSISLSTFSTHRTSLFCISVAFLPFLKW